MAQPKTYRFVFSDLLQDYFATFAEEYCNLERKEFKQKWEEWINIPLIYNTIQDEISAIKAKGFDGDVLDKMFKCVRYYFRKKAIKELSVDNQEVSMNQAVGNQDQDQTLTEKEIKWLSHLPKVIIQKIDAHIQEQTHKNISPYDRYVHFYKENNSFFTSEFEKIIPANSIGINKEGELFQEFVQKIKKSYKNRIYKNTRSLVV